MASFFLQAEDGIRDADVTGVQTCALPIFGARPARPGRAVLRALLRPRPVFRRRRSEERRVGKECSTRWPADDENKKSRCDRRSVRGPAMEVDKALQSGDIREVGHRQYDMR